MATLRKDGWTVIEGDLAYMADTLAGLGTPLHVFTAHTFWRPVVAQPLQVDCCNMQYPPEYVLVYAETEPAVHLVAPLVDRVNGKDVGCEARLSRETTELLNSVEFQEGDAVDQYGVGGDANPFRVLNMNSQGWRYRWTGRLLDREGLSDAVQAAVGELAVWLGERTVAVELGAGQALLVDQRRAVHGSAGGTAVKAYARAE